MRRGIAATALVASIALAATACGGSDSGDSADGPVTITWWDTSNATNEAPTYKALVKEFEAAHKDIKVKYVNVPFEHQSQLPVFDTIVPDFNLVQLFRKYQFVGPDRVADTDQLSFGITTRLLSSRSGAERLSATLGRTHYLDVQTVSLPNQVLSGASDSDYVAELGVSLSSKLASTSGAK